LCLQRDLSVLSYTSFCGVACQVFLMSVMQMRFMDGTYAEGGLYYDSVPLEMRPDFGALGRPELFTVSISTFVLFGNLATGYLAHYNAPIFYSQMRRRSPRRFNNVVFVGFSIALGLYIWVMTTGYLTFGRNASGNILNNYSA